MQTKRLLWLGVPVLVVAALLPMSVSAGGAKHVRWDIIHLAGGVAPGPITADHTHRVWHVRCSRWE